MMVVISGHSFTLPLLQSPAKLKRKRDEQKENMPSNSGKKTVAAPTADLGKPHKKEAEMPDPARVQDLMEIGVIRLPVKVSICWQADKTG